MSDSGSLGKRVFESLYDNHLGIWELNAAFYIQSYSLSKVPEDYSCPSISLSDSGGTPYGLMQEMSDYVVGCQELLPQTAAVGVSAGLIADAYRRTDHWQSRSDDVKKELVDKWFDVYFATSSISQKLE